nr:uncharacterized protein LOC128695980 [Cherax quadricarinatus]
MVLPFETLGKGWVGKRNMGSGSSGLRKFWLLLWKNWTLQRRRKIQTVVEVALPVVFCVLLVIIRDLAPYGDFPEPTYYKPFNISGLPENLTPNDGGGFFDGLAEQIFGDSLERRRRSLPVLNQSDLPYQSVLHKPSLSSHPQYRTYLEKLKKSKYRRKRFLDFFDFWGSDTFWPLAFSPNTTAVQKLMSIVASRLNVDERGYGFTSEEELVKRLTRFYKNEDEDVVEDILGGVVFTNPLPADDQLPENIEVSYCSTIIIYFFGSEILT